METNIDTSVGNEHIKTVLVVEDDMLIIQLISMKLKESNIEAHISVSGADALGKIEEINPDVVVLDLMLPEKSGEDILKEMKSDEDLKDIPVLIFTNMNKEENAERMLALGAEDYLVKASTDLNDLIDKIEILAKK